MSNQKRKRIDMVPLGQAREFQDALTLVDKQTQLRAFLEKAPALATQPLTEEEMSRPLQQFLILSKDEPSGTPLYRPPGMVVGNPGNGSNHSGPSGEVVEKHPPGQDGRAPAAQDGQAAPENPAGSAPETDGFPVSIGDEEAVKLAYSWEIESAASFLRANLSVLIMCDKLVVDHLFKEMAGQAMLHAEVLTVPAEEDNQLMPRSLRQRQLAILKEKIKNLKEKSVLVLPHLDLLAGGTESNMPSETREVVELMYENSNRLLLAFADRSLDIPEVLSARFAVRLLISGVSRMVRYPNKKEKPLGKALVTASEAGYFKDFDPEGLYKNVAGMNPVRLRHGLTYAVKKRQEDGHRVVPVTELYRDIRAFKAQTSAKFEVPDVKFEDIGGYAEVKTELEQALQLMAGSFHLPDEKLRRELIPRGFIFHGPPGTGKTLFAKAIANRMNATIQVVSGPEITDKYVGEGERKLREIFTEARRNAPAVIVFDEFDSIATQRSGRDDGGSRAGNAMVAQILTEMDGFRPEVPMLVIGTTNRLDIIDEALLRPARFKPVAIGLPDQATRLAIAKVHAAHFQIKAPPELLEVIAYSTNGFNGDEIRSLFRDACVGLHCQVPSIPANARRFGALVGMVRMTHQQRKAGQTVQKPGQPGRDTNRPGSSGTMMPMTPNRAVAKSGAGAPKPPGGAQELKTIPIKDTQGA